MAEKLDSSTYVTLKEFDFSTPFTRSIIVLESDSDDDENTPQQKASESIAAEHAADTQSINQKHLDMPSLDDDFPAECSQIAPTSKTGNIEDIQQSTQPSCSQSNDTTEKSISNLNTAQTSDNSELINDSAVADNDETREENEDTDAESNSPHNNEDSNDATKTAQAYTALHRKYLNNLLEILAENLISILNSFYKYKTTVKHQYHPDVIQQTNSNFIHTKNHFFKLSYHTVVNIVMPRHSASFEENFLKKTTILAKAKSLSYNYKDFERLYREMMVWVKIKKNEIEAAIIRANHSTVSQHLTAPPVSNTTHNPQSSVPVESINTEPFGQSLNTYTNEYITYVQNMQQNLQQNMQQNMQQNIHNPLNRNVLANPKSYSHRPLPYYLHQTPPWRLKSQNLQMESDLRSNQLCREQIESPYSTSYQENPLQVRIDTQANPYQETQRMQTMEHHQPILINNHMTYQQCGTDLGYNVQDNITALDGSRSSVSRDSGINISPRHSFDSSNNYSYDLQDSPSTQNTSAVTPTYIKAGNCYVCGKTTNKKCLACLKPYYCSHQCQIQDWSIHMPNCKVQSY